MDEHFSNNRKEKHNQTQYKPEKEEEINEIDRIIFDELCKGNIKEESKKYYVKVIKDMIKKNHIEGIIFGCTEIEMLVKQSDLDVPIFDTTQSHIDCIVDYSLEKNV